MNSVYMWLIGVILFLVIEVATMGLTTIWFAGGALVALLLAMANVSVLVQVVVFLVISLILLLCTRPLAMRFFNQEREKTNVDSMIGKQAIVLTEINNLSETGQVNLGGIEWSARAYCEEKIIPAGAVVVVKKVQGVKVIVEEVMMKPHTENNES